MKYNSHSEGYLSRENHCFAA